MKKTIVFVLSLVAGVSMASAEVGMLSFDGKIGPKALDFKSMLPEISGVQVKAEPVASAKSLRGYNPRKACETVELWASDGTNIRREITIYTSVSGSDEWANAVAYLTVTGPALQAGQTEKIEVCYDFAAGTGSYRVKKSPFQHSVSIRDIAGYNSFELYLARI